jgi:hypothetical protein
MRGHTPRLTLPLIAAICACLAGVLTFSAPAADAQGKLTAKVVLTQAKIPDKLTEKGLVQFATKNRATRLRETTDEPLDERKWRANMVVAFNRPPGDLEFHVLFFDIHDGPRLFVEDMATFVNDRSQKTFLQKVNLPRPRFKPNRNMELVVVVKRQEVTRMKFGVLGEEKRRSGVVEFSDDER